MTTHNTPVTSQEGLEKLSEKIHKLYCVQYEKDHKEPYWTNGDYSKLEERMKGYDRNIAWFILGLLHSHNEEMIASIEGFKKKHGIVYDGFSPDADLGMFNAGLDASLTIIKSKLNK